MLSGLTDALIGIGRDFPEEEYAISVLTRKFQSLYKEDKPADERMQTLVCAAIELTDMQAPRWEMIAGRLFNCDYLYRLRERMGNLNVNGYYSKMAYLHQQCPLHNSTPGIYSR